jgi:uncharacterized membrane protein
MSYLKQPVWWAGFLTLTIGEIGNFAAYSLAPAILVTPMGALSVFTNALLSTYYLGEHMTHMGHFGMLLCVAGTTFIMGFAPEEKPIENVLAIEQYMGAPVFKVYIIMNVIAILIMVYVDCRHNTGAKHIIYYILLCSLVGAILVPALKGIGIAIVATFRGENQFSFRWENRLTYYFLATTIVCLASQVNYLNRALDVFGSSKVVPIYFVVFTSCVLTGSQVLYRNLDTLAATSLLGLIIGCIMTFTGVYLVGREAEEKGRGEEGGITEEGVQLTVMRASDSEMEDERGADEFDAQLNFADAFSIE